MTAFLDFPPAQFEQGSTFWRAAAATRASAPRGTGGEFAILLPEHGDAFLRVQRLRDGPAGCHLDLHAEDTTAATHQAARLGARVVRNGAGFNVLSSPGGLAFCIVGYHGETERPSPVHWPGGQRSLVDQLSLDIPPGSYDRECGFWSELTGWPLNSGSRPEFGFLTRPAGMPLRLLLQRLDDSAAGCCTAHPDLACDDVAAEVARHVELGAGVVRVMPNWTTLRDPAGLCYCVTRRSPDTGTL